MNTNLEIFFFLIENLNSVDCSYNSPNEKINISDKEIEEKFKEKGISINLTSIGIELDVNSLDFLLFWNDDEFLDKKEKYKNADRDIGIVNKNGDSKFYSIHDKKVLLNKVESSSYFFQNTIAYSEFLNFLQEKSNGSVNEFHFVDHFDKTSNKILLTSSTEPGKLVVPIGSSVPVIDDKINFEKVFNRLKDSFSDNNKHLPSFIKNEIYNQISKIQEDKRLGFLVNNFQLIMEKSELNFQVFLHDLSIDKLKADYIDYKNKYFEALSNISSKLTNQILAFPLTVAASCYAIVKIETYFFPLILVLLAIFCASIFTSFILVYYKKDVKYLQKTFEKDFLTLSSSPFFHKYPNELSDFNFVKNGVNDKLGFLKIIINSYYIITWLFVLGITFFTVFIKIGIGIKIVSWLISGVMLIVLVSYLVLIKYRIS